MSYFADNLHSDIQWIRQLVEELKLAVDDLVEVSDAVMASNATDQVRAKEIFDEIGHYAVDCAHHVGDVRAEVDQFRRELKTYQD
jgi:hypothetical protein